MAWGVVRRIVDGDTFEIISGERIRIAGVNAPELNRAGGLAAKNLLNRIMPPGTMVGMTNPVTWSYGRSVRYITVRGRDIRDLIRTSSAPRRR